MPSKVRVYGKAQNRTVLGIINAYLVMYPHATKEDLDKAFPSSELLKRASGMKDFKSLFRTPEEWKKDVANQGLWFSESDERLKLQDGKEYILLKLWPKEAFEDMVSHASMYGIEVAKLAGIPATVNVGKEYSGQSMEIMTTYSRDGSNLNNPSSYENHIVDDEGNIQITEFAPIPK